MDQQQLQQKILNVGNFHHWHLATTLFRSLWRNWSLRYCFNQRGWTLHCRPVGRSTRYLFPFPENFHCHRRRKQFQYPRIWQESGINMNWRMNGCQKHLLFMLFVEKLCLKLHNCMCVNGFVKIYIVLYIHNITSPVLQ